MVEAEKQKKKKKEDDDRNAAAERERASRVLLRSPSDDDGSSLVEASSRGRTRGRESTGSLDMTPTKTKATSAVVNRAISGRSTSEKAKCTIIE